MTLAATALAHDVRPAYLQIDRLGGERYALLWRTPLLSGMPLPVVLALPEESRDLSQARLQTLPDQRIERRAVEIPGGLAGKRIEFVGLEATITDVLVRIDTGDGDSSTALVRPDRPWIELDPDRGTLEIARVYVLQGIEHILYGIDHLLFVASLLLVVRGWRMLIQTITAFTIAHSITLTCATYGLVNLPPAPVETMIAASILLVAVEAVRRQRGGSSLTIRWPWVVAFAFGLLHGFGFAGALQQLGLPQGDIPLALLMFNVGVEIGQLMFIVLLLAVLAGLNLLFPGAYRRAGLYAASYTIGIVACFWTFERLYATFA